MNKYLNNVMNIKIRACSLIHRHPIKDDFIKKYMSEISKLWCYNGFIYKYALIGLCLSDASAKCARDIGGQDRHKAPLAWPQHLIRSREDKSDTEKARWSWVCRERALEGSLQGVGESGRSETPGSQAPQIQAASDNGL